MKRVKRSRTTTDSEDLEEMTPSDISGDSAVVDSSPEKSVVKGSADDATPLNPPKRRGRPPKPKVSLDGKDVQSDRKALLPEGCEAPTEVTPVLLIKNVFNAQGECIAEEAKSQVLDGNSLQLVASIDTSEDTPKKPRRGRPPLVKKTDDVNTGGSTKQDDKTKEVRRGRPPKIKTREEPVDKVEEDGNNAKNSGPSSKNIGSGDGDDSEKVQPLENSQPRVAKRGRPPKRTHPGPDTVKSDDTKIDTEAPLESQPLVKKRGRGRPPKIRPPENVTDSAQKEDQTPPVKNPDDATPEGTGGVVKKRAGRPRKTTESADSSNDTPARNSEQKRDVNTLLMDSASARRSRQLKAKKIFEDYEEYIPGKVKPKVVPMHTMPHMKKVKRVVSGASPGRPRHVPQKIQDPSSDDDMCSVINIKQGENDISSPKSGGTSENDFPNASKETEVFSLDTSSKSPDHKPPSAAQVIIIKSKPKVESGHADKSIVDSQEADAKSCEQPTPKSGVENAQNKQTKLSPGQIRLPRQQRSARIPAKRQPQITSFKAEMCMAPEIKLDLPVSGLLDSVNMSTQPEIRTLYMFQNTSTNGWLKIICKRISGVQFYQCPLCPYKDPVPRKVADHLHEDHASLVSIAEGKCTRIFATFLFMFCRHCDFIAYEKLALWYHFEQYHGLTDMINAKPVDPATINMDQFTPLQNHALKNAKVVLRCNECDFLSLSKRQAMLHVLKEHSGVNSCIGNGFVIISQLDSMSPTGDETPSSEIANLPDELKSMVMKDCFVCTECMFVTYKRALMEIHCVNNHAKRLLLLVCSVCGSQFDTTYKMSNHIATAHSESKRQFCTVTLVDADGKEDQRLHELAEQRSIEAAAAAEAAASQETVEAVPVETKPVSTVQLSRSSLPTGHTVSTTAATHQARPAKTRPVAVVSGSSCGQTSARKTWPGQSVVKPVHQPQQQRSLQAKWPTDQTAKVEKSSNIVSSQKSTQLQTDTESLAKPLDGEKQLTYIQMPDGTHHQVELTEDKDGQLQYVLTDNRESGIEVAADSDEACYVKLPDGSIQPLSSMAEGTQAAGSAEEIRYLQLPDGSLQQLPAEMETGGEVHYVQLADGSLQQISAMAETAETTQEETTQEVHYMKLPDGSLQQVTDTTQLPESDKNVRYVALEDGTAQQVSEADDQVHYGKLTDGSVPQVTESGQTAASGNAEKAGKQDMHCIKLPDGSFQQVTESGQEVCYVKMPDGSIQQVAESVQSVENGDGQQLTEAAADRKTVTEQTGDGEPTTYVQYIIQMDNDEQSAAAGDPQVAPVADRSKVTSGTKRVTAADQSGSSNVTESRSEGTKMVSLLSQDVLANVQAQQTTAAAAPTETGSQPMVMQAYNVNGETIILCCEPGMVISDQQAAQVIQAAPREAGSTTTNGQRILYIQNETPTGNFEDAFQTFVNSNSTQEL